MSWTKTAERLLLMVLCTGFSACGSEEADEDTGREEHASDSDSSPENESETGTTTTNASSETDESTTDTAEGTDTATESEPGTDSTVEYKNLGMCGISGEAEVTTTSFVGFEEHYLLAEEDSSIDQCRVRYELRSVGTPELPCDECLWSFVLEKHSPQTIADLDGSCANSELGLDSAAITSSDGETITYGYVSDYMSHGSALMRLNDTAQAWEAVSSAFWDETTSQLYFDRQDGFCAY